MRKDRLMFEAKVEAWDIKYKRELADIDAHRTVNERTHGMYTHCLLPSCVMSMNGCCVALCLW